MFVYSLLLLHKHKYFYASFSYRNSSWLFYLLIFYSEKFSTWVRCLPFAVNVNLHLATNNDNTVTVSEDSDIDFGIWNSDMEHLERNNVDDNLRACSSLKRFKNLMKNYLISKQ